MEFHSCEIKKKNIYKFFYCSKELSMRCSLKESLKKKFQAISGICASSTTGDKFHQL